jgi:predicted  nucleic acid-binding Zn-ribbon protein
MKRFNLSLLVGLACMLFLCPQPGYAQTSGRSEQVMNDLLTEVRQLRQDVRRMTATAYRAQTMIERLRVQQGQVNRLTLDLNRVRLELSELKSSRVELKKKLADVSKKVEAGLVPPTEVNTIKTTLANLDQREPELMLRESQLGAELTAAQGDLEVLNKRLEAIEEELLTISKGEDQKPVRKN